MRQQIFEEMQALGFSRAIEQQIEQRLDIIPPHFGAAERRTIAGHEVKLLALLTYGKKQHHIAVRSYDVIDLTIRQPEYQLPDIRSLDEQMKKVNWDSPQFGWEQGLAGLPAGRLLPQVTGIEEQLKNLSVYDYQRSIDCERLKLKYMYDSLYGYRHHLDGLCGFNYEQHFNVLSIDRHTGLCNVADAVDMLCRQQLNNYQPKEVIINEVAARMQSPAIKVLAGKTRTVDQILGHRTGKAI